MWRANLAWARVRFKTCDVIIQTTTYAIYTSIRPPMYVYVAHYQPSLLLTIRTIFAKTKIYYAITVTPCLHHWNHHSSQLAPPSPLVPALPHRALQPTPSPYP